MATLNQRRSRLAKTVLPTKVKGAFTPRVRPSKVKGGATARVKLIAPTSAPDYFKFEFTEQDDDDLERLIKRLSFDFATKERGP